MPFRSMPLETKKQHELKNIFLTSNYHGSVKTILHMLLIKTWIKEPRQAIRLHHATHLIRDCASQVVARVEFDVIP